MTQQPQAPGQALDLALIGNCRVAAFVNRGGRIVWWCFPRFDGDPVFSRLLAGDEEKGFCDVVMANMKSCESQYVRNTAIVETVMTDTEGASIRITDFAPRFERFERTFRPPQIIRRVEPISGLPRIAIRVRPTCNYGGPIEEVVVGSNHIRYLGGKEVVRLTTEVPLSYIVNEVTFPLTRPMSLFFGPDDPLRSGMEATSREFLDRTREHWLNWVRNLAIPLEWQPAVIRAAITLKLCSFEETGAIVAAHTTSVPEAPSTSRNWDYRYCWLRDAYFVIDALNRLGATNTMEDYLNYIATVASDTRPLRPVHSIVPFEPLEERIAADLKGFQGFGPVRVGNQAVDQIQNDVYGSVILSVTQMFLDERLPRMGDEGLFRRLEWLGEKAYTLCFESDAGPWEFRGRAEPHTYSATMCWVACDRLSQIAKRLGLTDRASYWRNKAVELRERILQRAWDADRKTLTGAMGRSYLDASVLLVSELGLLSPDDERFRATCDAIGRDLIRNGRVMRYAAPDDFGAPETAFLACEFWYMDALAQIGRKEEARQMFETVLAARNHFGLLSEDIHPETGMLWGNLPQTYSMAGIINTAARLSLSWEDAWARASS